MNPEGCYLFVYGTLRPACKHPMAAYLAQRGRLLGSAVIRGRLFQLTWYPGLVASTNPEDLVQGDVYELLDPEKTLGELDRYEIDASSLFARREASITHVSGNVYKAWAYYYLGETDERQRISSGDFLKR